MLCVIPPASPATTFAWRMVSRSVVFPWSTWPSTVTTGSARLEQRIVFVVVVAEHRQELDFLLAPRLDEQHLRAERLRDELDHLVGERHGRGDHLARFEEDANEVGRRTVQLRRELLHGDTRETTISPSGTGASAGVSRCDAGSSSERSRRRFFRRRWGGPPGRPRPAGPP